MAIIVGRANKAEAERSIHNDCARVKDRVGRINDKAKANTATNSDAHDVKINLDRLITTIAMYKDFPGLRQYVRELYEDNSYSIDTDANTSMLAAQALSDWIAANVPVADDNLLTDPASFIGLADAFDLTITSI